MCEKSGNFGVELSDNPEQENQCERYFGQTVSHGYISSIVGEQGWQKGGKYSYFPGRREILVIPGKYW